MQLNHKKTNRKVLFVGLYFFLTGFLILSFNAPSLAQAKPDWKQGWEKALSGAKKEGKVVVWGPPGEFIRKAMTEGFSKAFPDIPIEFSGGRGGEQATRIKAERDGGVYSVDALISGTTTAMMQMKPMKALDPIEPVLFLPEVTDLKYWRDNMLEFSDAVTRYNLVFVNQVKNPLVYNLEVKAEEVDQLYELLDPKWKGKFVINDPLPSGAGNVTFRWIWRVLGPEKATDYYRKIRANAGVVDRDQRRQIEWVAQGKYAFLFGPSDGVMRQLLQRGLKFAVLGEFKDYGAYITASFGSAMLMNKRPHPNGATVFINWLLSKDGQTAYSTAMTASSRRVDVPTDHLPPDVIPKPGRIFTGQPKPGDRYWLSHSEENVKRTAEEEKILKELFGR